MLSQLVIDPLNPLFPDTIVLIEELPPLPELPVLEGAADVLEALPGLVEAVTVTAAGPVLHKDQYFVQLNKIIYNAFSK